MVACRNYRSACRAGRIFHACVTSFRVHRVLAPQATEQTQAADFNTDVETPAAAAPALPAPAPAETPAE